MKRPKPTQAEIAKACNVSQSLVSLVLSGAKSGSSEAARILAIAEKMGYHPRRPVATSRRQRVLAYIQPVMTRKEHGESWIYESYDDYYAKIHADLQQEAFEAGYSLIARPYTDPRELTHWLSEWAVDGVLLHVSDPSLARWIGKRQPLVLVNRHDTPYADAVSVNQEELVILAMDYLRDKGHTRIVFIPGTPLQNPLRRIRNQAYQDYTRLHQLPSYQDAFLRLGDSPSMAAITETLYALFEQPEAERPTAVIAGSYSAAHHLKSLKERGFHLPGQISIIGIDNISAADWTEPALTTLDTRTDEIARISIELLVARIRNPDAAFQKIFVSPKLIERKSVATYPAPTLAPDHKTSRSAKTSHP